MIKVFAVANLTRDVETRKLQSGTTMASFSIAVNRPYAKDKTDFFNCVAFSGLAETCEKYLKKGSKIGLYGTLQNRSYEKDGAKRYITEIIVESIDFTSSPKKETVDVTPKEELMYVQDDDIPF